MNDIPPVCRPDTVPADWMLASRFKTNVELVFVGFHAHVAVPVWMGSGDGFWHFLKRWMVVFGSRWIFLLAGVFLWFLKLLVMVMI